LPAHWRQPCAHYLPPRDLGSVAGGKIILPLDVLPRVNSVQLLRRHYPSLDKLDADSIAAEVGDLPLALDLGGRYLWQYRDAVTPADYLRQIRNPTLLQHRSFQGGRHAQISPTGHDMNVARTFMLSYEQLQTGNAVDKVALSLVARAAHLASGVPIPRKLLLMTLQAPDEDPDIALDIVDGLTRLTDLGLMEMPGEGVVRIHRLVSRFVRAIQSEATARTAVETALIEIFSELARDEKVAEAQPIEPHLRVVTEAAFDRVDVLGSELCDRFASHLRLSQDFVEARKYAERALTISEALYGVDDPATAREVNHLGYILYYLRDYTAAGSYLLRAVELYTQRNDLENAAAVLDNLGQLMSAQQQFGEAVKYYEQALELRERALGPMHPYTAITLHNLGATMLGQGAIIRAREYLTRSLAIRQQVLPPLHVHTAASLNTLSDILLVIGDLDIARSYKEQALAIREQLLGRTHPRTLSTVRGLYGLLIAQNDLVRAEAYREWAELDTPGSGSNVVSNVNNVGFGLWSRGNYSGARRCYEQVLVYDERTGLQSSADLAVPLNNLGMVLTAQADYEKAQRNYERAIALMERDGKATTVLSARFLNNLGVLLILRGEYAQARVQLERALALRMDLLGEAHRDTAATQHNLGLLQQAEGDIAGAHLTMAQALTVLQRTSDSERELGRCLHDLGRLHQAKGDVERAEEHLRRALAVREKELAERHPDRGATLYALALVLQASGRPHEARDLLERALAIQLPALGPHHPETIASRATLTQLADGTEVNNKGETDKPEQPLGGPPMLFVGEYEV
jgi:tetratricopeptide (TPR) repeat protein